MLMHDAELTSRRQLVEWLNHLLDLQMTKVEQCGTGAALCQVFDSIGLEIPVPMNKVKFNANTEYAYRANFTILQECFLKNRIDRPVNVESLIKCKPQDNLEFLQWAYKYWYENTPSHDTSDYNGLDRRKGMPTAGGGGGGGAGRPATSSVQRTIGRGAMAQRPNSAATAATAALQQENTMLKENVVGLERERDFYFGKLRDIELLIQQAVEEDPEIEKDEDGLIKHIQNILYSTEDGFEIPAEGEGEPLDDQETF
jgi:RP/EB family microtubule-associated protein